MSKSLCFHNRVVIAGYHDRNYKIPHVSKHLGHYVNTQHLFYHTTGGRLESKPISLIKWWPGTNFARLLRFSIPHYLTICDPVGTRFNTQKHRCRYPTHENPTPLVPITVWTPRELTVARNNLIESRVLLNFFILDNHF